LDYLLDDQGANASVVLPDGSSALLLAANAGHVGVVSLLLRASGDEVDVANHPGFRPLYLAAKNGHGFVVGVLLDYGADTTAAMADGSSPLSVAADNTTMRAHHRSVAKGGDG
jgi:ankyrin repeat protein